MRNKINTYIYLKKIQTRKDCKILKYKLLLILSFIQENMI